MGKREEGREMGVRSHSSDADPGVVTMNDKEMSLDDATQFVAIRDDSCVAKATFVSARR